MPPNDTTTAGSSQKAQEGPQTRKRGRNMAPIDVKQSKVLDATSEQQAGVQVKAPVVPNLVSPQKGATEPVKGVKLSRKTKVAEPSMAVVEPKDGVLATKLRQSTLAKRDEKPNFKKRILYAYIPEQYREEFARAKRNARLEPYSGTVTLEDEKFAYLGEVISEHRFENEDYCLCTFRIEDRLGVVTRLGPELDGKIAKCRKRGINGTAWVGPDKETLIDTWINKKEKELRESKKTGERDNSGDSSLYEVLDINAINHKNGQTEFEVIWGPIWIRKEECLKHVPDLVWWYDERRKRPLPIGTVVRTYEIPDKKPKSTN